MKISDLTRCAVSICMVATMLAGCGRSQALVGAPGTAQQGPATETQAALVRPRPGPATAKNLYVANDPIGGTGSVTVYAPGTGTPLRTITDGIYFPSSLTFDVSQNLYVSNSAHNFPKSLRLRAVKSGGALSASSPSVTVYASGGTTPLRTISQAIENPNQVAIAPSGNVYVANGYYGAHTGNVVVYKSGTSTLLRKIVKGTYDPFRLAFDSSGNLYVANEGPGSIGPGWVSVYDSGKKKLSRMITDGIDDPVSLAVDGSGNLYVGNYQSSAVTVYAPGSSSVLRTITDGVTFAFALAFDNSGNLYVANYNTVTVYASGSSTLLRTISTSAPYSLAFGSNGYLNVANLSTSSSDGSITEYASPYDTLARTITDGIDNPVWIGFGP
jgi:sugar lactone lactonase YvrE